MEVIELVLGQSWMFTNMSLKFEHESDGVSTAEPRLFGVNADQAIARYLKQPDMQSSIIASVLYYY